MAFRIFGNKSSVSDSMIKISPSEHSFPWFLCYSFNLLTIQHHILTASLSKGLTPHQDWIRPTRNLKMLTYPSKTIWIKMNIRIQLLYVKEIIEEIMEDIIQSLKGVYHANVLVPITHCNSLATKQGTLTMCLSFYWKSNSSCVLLANRKLFIPWGLEASGAAAKASIRILPPKQIETCFPKNLIWMHAGLGYCSVTTQVKINASPT